MAKKKTNAEPTDLTDEAKAFHKRLSELLVSLGRKPEEYTGNLWAAADLWSEAREAARIVKRRGLVIYIEGVKDFPNPAIKIKNDALNGLKANLLAMGLDASSRDKLAKPYDDGEQDVNPFED